MQVKLRSQRGAYRLEIEGDNKEVVSIWVSYLPNAGVLMIRLNGDHGDGEIDVEDMIKRLEH